MEISLPWHIALQFLKSKTVYLCFMKLSSIRIINKENIDDI